MGLNVQNFTYGVNFGPLPSAPTNPVNGDAYYDTSLNVFRFYQNGAWQTLGGGGSSDPITLAQISTPGAPASGYNNLYFKNDNNLYIQNSADVETPILQSGSAAFATYASSQITTQSTGITNTSFETFSNSPVFTFTPTISGVYKIYASVVAENGINNDQATLRIFNTAGGATLISESQGAVEGHLTGYGTAQYSSYIQSTYTLIAGTSYIFDIQAKVQSGDTVYMDGSITNFCMFAEGIGLNGTLNTGGSSFALFTSNVVNTQSSFIGSVYPSFTTFDNSPAFTFTPVISGKYKIYATVPIYEVNQNQNVNIRIFNTSGGATLLQESQAYGGAANIVSNNVQTSLTTQSIYELVAGTAYVFDIQGAVSGGTAQIAALTVPFYMFAEGIGLSNTSQNFPVNMKVTGTGSWSASANIILGTISWDSNSAYNTSTGEYTVPYAGYYLVGWNANATTATKQVGIYVNGTQQELIDNGYSADPGAVGTSTVVKVNAGDIITWVANIGFSANVTTQWVSSISLANALLGPQGRTTGSAFAYYASTVVNTIDTGVTNTIFETFSNSPGFTVTPTISGIYKVYASVPFQVQDSAQFAQCRIWNTSGGGSLLQESQATIYSQSGSPEISNQQIQSTYTLIAGRTYVFDIQARSDAGTVYDRGDQAPFFMFCEGIGLSGQFQSPVTPWQSNLSVTPSASFGSYTGLKTLTRVVGDTMEFKVYLTVGTSVSSIMSLALPAGYTIDASKLSNGQSLLNGFATSITTSSQSINTSTWATYPFFDGSDISNIYFTPSTGTTTTQQFDKAFALNFAEGGAPWVAEFSVPIVGLYGGQLDGVSTIAKSASTGVSWSIPYNASFNPVLDPGTNPLQAIVTTNGGDVEIGLQDDGSGNTGSVYADDRNNASSTVTIRFKRNGVVIASQVMYNQNNISIHEMQIPPNSFRFIDSPPAGTWTYTVEAMTSGTSAANSQITYSTLYAKPLSALGGSAGSGAGPSAWLPYTPTFTGMGTVTGASFWYKTDGADSIFIKGTWTIGTPTATQAQISLPPTYTSNGTKINGTIESCGTMNHNNSNTVAFAVTIQPNVTYLTFGYNNNTGGDLNPDNGNVIFAPGVTYSFSSTAIPIS